MSSEFQINIFRLPFLCIQNIMEFWDLYELFLFSKLSKISNFVAKKSKKKKGWEIAVKVGESSHFDVTHLGKNHIWRFGPVDLSHWNEYNTKLFLETTELLTELLNCSIRLIDIEFSRLPYKVLEKILNWIRDYERIQTIEVFNAAPVTKEEWKLIFLNLNKDIGRLLINGPWDDGDLTLVIPKPIRVDRFKQFGNSTWLDLKCLLGLNWGGIQMLGTPTKLTNGDLNLFLKSWQRGETNQDMTDCNWLKCVEKIDVKTVCRGLGAVVRHPMRVKRCYTSTEIVTSFVHGGIDIKRIDGKTMTIELLCHLTDDENKEVPEKVIKKYKEYYQKWKEGLMEDIVFEENEMDSVDMNDGNVDGIEHEESNLFSIHVW